MDDKHWDRDSALEQIARCEFACEGGPLKNNVAWTWLRKALEIGPKYLPGQGVYFKVGADVAGVRLERWVHYYVVGVSMSSDTERRLWTYALSNDPPSAYHYGTVHHRGVAERDMRLCPAAE